MNADHPREESLDAFLLDELGAEARAGIAQHLRECPECRARVAPLESALRAYRATARSAAPELLLDALRAAQVARRKSPRSAAIGHRSDVLAAGFAAVILFLGGFWLGRSTSLPAREDAPGERPAIRQLAPGVARPLIGFNATSADRLGAAAFRDSTPD